MLKPLILSSLVLLTGCSTFCEKYYPAVIPNDAGPITVSKELLKPCEPLSTLVLTGSESDPFLAVLEAHRADAEIISKCAAKHRDAVTLLKRLANIKE